MANGAFAVLTGGLSVGREFNKLLLDVLRPPALVIGFLVRGLYWLLIGWWYERHLGAKQGKQLRQHVQNEMCFLFAEHAAQVVPNGSLGHLEILECSVVTVAVGGVLLRFVRWREDFQVHVAAERLPNEWHELSSLLNAMEPKIRRHSIVFIQDSARLLRNHMDMLKEGLSQDRYPALKEQLDNEHHREMAVTSERQDEINQRLYT